jgi:hypothetical protein
MIEQTINLLGLRATDKITGVKGVVTSVCFDLYGCVQAIVSPPAKENGEIQQGHWFDVNRLDVEFTDDFRVMPVPDFAARAATPAGYDHGAAPKPEPGA